MTDPRIQITHKVKCVNPECPTKGKPMQAVVNLEIVEADAGLYDICPVCNCYSLAADRGEKRDE